MSLNNMVVYNRFAETTMMEMLQHNMEVFNAASQGTILMSSGMNPGDFKRTSMYKSMNKFIRSRDPYGTGPIPSETLYMKDIAEVKVARGTHLLHFDYTQFDWIGRSPEEAGVKFGKALAEQMMQDYLEVALGVLRTAMLNDYSEIGYDATSLTPPRNSLTLQNMTRAVRLFGDRSSRIKVWVMHSTPRHDLFLQSLNNYNSLFSYDNVEVGTDGFGRTFIMTDMEQLVSEDNSGNLVYHVLGLTPGAITIEQNNDFRQLNQEVLGQENLAHQMQAEWTFNLLLKGYGWNTGTGGAAPTDGALLVSQNWDRYVDDRKLLPGVLLDVKARLDI